MSDHLTPLQVCLATLGDRQTLERIAGSRPKGTYAWERSSVRRKAGSLPAHVAESFADEIDRLGRSAGRQLPIDKAWLIQGTTRRKIEHAREGLRAMGLPVPPFNFANPTDRVAS